MGTGTNSPASKDALGLFESCSGHWAFGDESIQIQPGDWYIAQRNGPARILQCKVNDTEHGWIVPTDPKAYLYDTRECFRARPDASEDALILAAVQADDAYNAWIDGFRGA